MYNLISDKKTLLPYLQRISEIYPFLQIFPVSALRGDSIERLEPLIIPLLPEGEAQFPKDQVTDRSLRFLAAEFVREKLTRHLGEELPYAISCEVERIVEAEDLVRIGVVIWVERPGQQAIVIGKKGAMLKQVGQEARKDIERNFGKKVFLETWVRVQSGWSNDGKALKSLGYE